jgi:hypothetical protein
VSLPVTLSLSGDQHAQLKQFLFPGDGNEAVAVLLCSRRAGDRRHRLLVRSIHEIAYEACTVRTPVQVTWPTELIELLLDQAEAETLSVVKVHSHPGGYRSFSPTDDISDRLLLPMIRGSVEADIPHGSMVMLPTGEMFGRVLLAEGFAPIECVSVAGDDLMFWYADAGTKLIPDFAASHAQIFDDGTIERLQRLSVAVVGCSGTGSPLIEQLVRLGVGEVVLVDDDVVEERNVNRILNTTMADAAERRLKVDVLAEVIEAMGLGTRVVKVAKNLWDREVVLQVAQCDVVFGCMDTVDGRWLLNTLATYYSLPYFDVGVRLVGVGSGDQKGRVREVCGTVNYLQPGRSSLLSRELFTLEQVAAAGLKRNDPSAHRQQIDDGYIKGIVGHRPAVISVNMFAASLAMNEFLARLHPYRETPNGDHAAVAFSLSSMELFSEPEESVCLLLRPRVGQGDVTPPLRFLELAERQP